MSGTLAALGIAGGVATAARAGGAFDGASQLFTAEDEERLKKLEKLEAAGQLGMTEGERAILEQRLMAPQLAAERQSRDVLASQQQIADVSGGIAAKQQKAITDVAMRERSRVGEQLQQQELAAKQLQLSQIASLREKQKAEKVGKVQAVLGGVAGAAEQYAQYQGAMLQETNREAMMQILRAQAEKGAGYSPFMNPASMSQLKMLYGLGGTTQKPAGGAE